MSGFDCDLEGFRQQASKFLRRMDDDAPTEALAGAWKALGIFYLNMHGDAWETTLAAGVMQHCASRWVLATI